MPAAKRGGDLVGAVLFLAVLAVPVAALAQADGGHAAHHPGGGAPPAASPAAPDSTAAPPSGGMGGMMDMMKGMAAPSAPVVPAGSPPDPSPQPATPGTAGMTPPPAAPAPAMAGGGAMGSGGMVGGGGCCGGGGAKPFYPALMDMPSLTPEARRFIEAEAANRLGSGSEEITIGQAALHHALSANDPLVVQQAVAGVRRGVLQVESGASALQAIGEDQSPRQVALAWFTGQMNVPVPAGMEMGDGPWGLSWYHLMLMAFLAASLLGAMLVHYARVRRIGRLVERLTPGGAAAGRPAGKPDPAATPTGAAAPLPPTPPASTGTAAPGVPAKADSPKRPWSGALRVAAIFRETPTVKTFRLMGLEGGAIPFSFLPGQFLTFSAIIDEKPIRRSYTIASSPAQCDYVEITVKREEQGAESRYLHDHVAVGDHLDVSGPSGVFTFTGKETDSVVLISGGVGITPMMCVLRYLTDCGYPGDIFFIHGARAAQDLIFREELEYLQKRHGNAHVTVTIADPEDASWTGARGQISKELIMQTVPEIARRRVHVCGPPAMMAAVKAELVELGVAKDKIKTEAFGPAQGAAPAPAPAFAPAAAPAPPADAAATTVPAPAADAPPSAQVEVEFSKSGKTGPLAPDQSVLEAAEAIGVAIDFSCRVGTCGTCVVPLTSGTVTMEVEDGLLPEDKIRGIILACQAKSVGRLVVDA